MFDTPDEKACELPGCEEIFTRPPLVGRPAFAKRKYHSRECAEQAKQGRPRGGSVLPIRAPHQPRYNAEGAWRPNAPGWPDVPRVPARVS